MDLDIGFGWEMSGSTREYASVISACAGICLKHHAHLTPVELKVDGDSTQTLEMNWREATAKELRTYGTAEDSEVIRFGAECVAVRLAARLPGLEVIIKASKGTGCDFWLDDPSAKYEGYEGLVRLEVSGILEDNEGVYRRRLRDKLAQMAPTDPIPGFAAIVMLGTPRANLTERR